MSEHQLRATFNTTRALKEILILLYFYETASAFSNQSFLKLLLIENQMTSFHTIVIFGLHSNKLLLLVLLLVCMWVCVCVCVLCVCVYVCVSWLSKAINIKPEFRSAMLCCGNLSASSTYVKDNQRKNFQAGKCAKECQLNRARQREVKHNSYKFSKKSTVSIATFLFSNLGRHPDLGSIVEPTLRVGSLFSREGLPNLFLSALAQVLT